MVPHFSNNTVFVVHQLLKLCRRKPIRIFQYTNNPSSIDSNPTWNGLINPTSTHEWPPTSPVSHYMICLPHRRSLT